MSIYDKIFPPKLLTLPNGKQVSKPRSRAPLAAVILVAMTILSVEVTGFDMGVLVSRIKEFFVILSDMIPPQWDYMPQIWQPLFDTIKMSLLGSFIGSILVVPFAMLASTNIIHSRVIVAAMRLLLSLSLIHILNSRLPLRLPLDLVMTSVGSVVMSSRSSSRRMYLRTVFSLIPTACPMVLMLGQH